MEDKPSDVLLSFIENYCVEAADEFLPSKNTNKQNFLRLRSWPGLKCMNFLCTLLRVKMILLKNPFFRLASFFHISSESSKIR